MPLFDLTVNGRRVQVDADPAMPLLWVLRDHLGLTGTKYSCGIAQCGACTVHIGGEAARSCVLPIGSVKAPVTTIEGLAADNPLFAQWQRAQVSQCGYCQPGQIMAAAALRTEATDKEIGTVMDGNLCRCGTYLRIGRALVGK